MELKPCPFCGGEAVAEFDSDWGMVVRCSRDCGAMTVERRYPLAIDPVKAWNNRAEPRTCETCYYYQTVYDRNRPTDRLACFGEHLRVAVGGLDWDEEAEAWADMAPDDSCSRWTAKKICRTIGANGEQVDACSQD